MDLFTNIAIDAMKSIYNKEPQGFQMNVIPHLIKMMAGQIPKQPVLMVQPTGAGKSAVPLTAAIVNGGITLIIENTLALGTDQASKVELNANSNHRRFVKSIHLDSIKSSKQQRSISSSIIQHCTDIIDTSIIIFSSPETLLKQVWTHFFIECQKQNLLNLICIDEIHMFVEFGCTFRPCFQLLDKSLFSHIQTNSTTSLVPILLMTATFNKQFESLLQKMIGFNINNENTFWASQSNFRKCHIDINIRYSTQHFRLMKEYLLNLIPQDSSHKAMIITNTALRATQCQTELNNWLDTKDKLHGDTVLVVGDRDPELKFAYTTEFTNKNYDETIAKNSKKLMPRFLIGTSGCIGTGLDCVDVHLVIRLGLSTNTINFIQEMDRCGRTIPISNNNDTTKDAFNIVFSIHDFVYLHKRINTTNNDEYKELLSGENTVDKTIISNDEMKEIENINFMKMCSMMFLNLGCWHYYLEFSSSNPDNDPYDPRNYSPCIHHCSYCTNSIQHIVKVIDRKELCLFLVNTMTNTTKVFSAVELGDALFNYPNSRLLIYKCANSKKPSAKSDNYMTIVQLILADIVRIEYDCDNSNRGFCILPHVNAEFNYSNDNYWQLIRYI